ncbi:hypothetical protein JJB99_01795 [Bradyrhizobium diazoefficiens]|uniref:hypothetical protein n=1 Tax=Bradyrhizobium diazoefficiens TaxID=1355477 RepID=UPI00190C7AB1|nr:hypothetical protein [Bradyrhizobium diazoefficiens]QQO14951.1 hypothetical protein JJB99_01795 [Bradyrhizobium diazoefficiens]
MSEELYLKSAQVRARYGGASDMWIIRRMRDDGFPEPAYFGGQRFWRERDLVMWEKQRIKAPKERATHDMRRVRAAKKAVHS